MKKKILVVIFLWFLLSPTFVLAQEDGGGDDVAITTTSSQENVNGVSQLRDEIFEALVMRILEQRVVTEENGAKITQQNLVLQGVKGDWRGKEIDIQGISKLDVPSAGVYKTGDQVVVQRSVSPDGTVTFTIIDFVRRGYLYLLTFVFGAAIITVGGIKGFKAVASLALSFLIIIYFMLPRILAGGNPLIIGVCGSFAVLAVIIYFTDGWNRKSHLAMASVFLSLVATMLLSMIFSGLCHLTGFSEESTFLIESGFKVIDFKGLLLAGILVGAVGVLDDVIVGQIEAVKQIQEANPSLPARKVFRMAYKVGNTHLGAIVNTLFLTYAGASLPILLLFVIKQEPFLTFGQIINNEAVATEIVRTLVGSIGVALSMPIATFLGAYFLRVKKK
jgi:uncharacterized membrane protein